MSEVRTLATLILGGPFDETELSDNDVQINAKVADALQLERVTGQDDVHIELVDRAEFDRLTAERDALQLRLNVEDQRIDKQAETIAGYQDRNSELVDLLRETSDYLSGSIRNAVWCDSILHKKMRGAITPPKPGITRHEASIIGIEPMPVMEYDEP